MKIFKSDSGDFEVFANEVGYVIVLISSGHPRSTILSPNDAAKLREALAWREGGETPAPKVP